MIDKFIVERAPWKFAKDPDPSSQKLVDETLYTAAEALRIICAWIYPVMPESAHKIWSQLGMPEPIESIRIADLHWGKLRAGQKVGTVSGVFPRLDAKAIEKMQELEVDRKARQAAIFAPASAQPARRGSRFPKISIDDFAKVELRVGQVVVAERVQGRRQASAYESGHRRALAPHYRCRHRRGLHSRTDGRPQGSDRRQLAASQIARHRIERHDRGCVARRRQARPGWFPGRRSSGSQAEVSLIDSHCHLDSPEFDDDREAVIERALEAGVEHMVAIGTGSGPPDLEAGMRLADKYPAFYATVGVHPHDAAKAAPADLED